VATYSAVNVVNALFEADKAEPSNNKSPSKKWDARRETPPVNSRKYTPTLGNVDEMNVLPENVFMG